MAFDILPAATDDAATVADVHLRAMEDNALLHAQFPNAEALSFLRQWLTNDTVEHTKVADKGVLVAKDDSGETASFVKWEVHGGKETDTQHGDEEWPACCRMLYLDSYADLTAKVKKGVMGDSPYYHVTFLCTIPNHGGKGAASKLLRRVQELAAADGLAVILESTMNAVTFYQKLGFRIAKELDLMLPKPGSDDPTELYEERCMVWRSEDADTSSN